MDAAHAQLHGSFSGLPFPPSDFVYKNRSQSTRPKLVRMWAMVKRKRIRILLILEGQLGEAINLLQRGETIRFGLSGSGRVWTLVRIANGPYELHTYFHAFVRRYEQ